jgi:hypothetical protein
VAVVIVNVVRRIDVVLIADGWIVMAVMDFSAAHPVRA